MPSAFNILTNLAPAAMSIAGAALLMTAAPLALALPFHNYPAAAIADIVLWITLATVLSFCAVRLMPRRAAPRCTLALAVFALFLLPQTEWDHMPAATQMLSLAGAALLLAGLPLCAPLKPVLAALDRLLSANRFLPSWLLIGIFYVTFLSAAVALSWHCFHFYPIYTDTEGQYIHAKYIAMGHLYWPAPPPPLSRFFYLPMSVDDHGKWYSQYQPLHVLLLALGHDLSAPWMVNPTEGALTLVATYMLARRITDEQTARLSALLMLGCQLILFMSSEYMNHASALLFATLFLWGYAETLHAQAEDRMNDACRAGFVTGLCIGAVFLVRPLTAIGVALPFIFHALWLMARDRRAWLEPFLAMAAGGLICLAFDGWYNLELTGSAWVMPYTKYSGSIESQVWFGKGHSFFHGLRSTHAAWLLMNRALFEWPLPCTAFVLIACLRPLKHPMLRLMLAMLLCYSAANVLNKWWSSVFGPRYLYETATTLIILTAVGICRLPYMLRGGEAAARGAVAVLVLLLFSVSAATRLPDNIRMYAHYFDDHPQFYYSMLSQSEKPALIFIGQSANKKDRTGKYRWVTHTNPPTEDSPVVFAVDLGMNKDRELMARYPHRHTYLERNGWLYPVDPVTFTSDAPPGPPGTP